MHKTATLILTIAALGLAAPGSVAGHCTTYSTAEPEVDIGTHYVDNDVIIGGVSIWVYEESNGIVGLQRGDEVVDNTCHGMIEADTIIV